ncbi:MAG: transglycosylase domain-containing protein, partial [Pseudorhodoplanes sp.]
MLAGLFKAPTRFAPHINLPAARARANVVLDNLVESGFMTEGQVFGARRNPASAVDRRDERQANYYLDWAFDEMRKLVETFPKSMTERVFVVRTGLDVGLQNQADIAVENALRQYGHEYGVKQMATVVMDIDGTVRAMVGGRDYGVSQFNRATDALRQPGSSFKPYVYATALANGVVKPNSTIVDGPICLGNWCPHNYSGGYSGSVTVTQALVRSINTVPVRLSVMLGGDKGPKAGRAKIIETARKFGLRTPLPDTPSLPIGADEVTVLDHTAGYATFPNAGKAVQPHAILEVRNGNGELIWRFDRDGKKPEQVISPQVALEMNVMMNKVVEEGTGKRAMLPGVKAAGKTGTTNAYRDAWFAGFTGNYVAAVWAGNDDYAPMKRLTGGALPAMTWHEIMAYAHRGIELKNIPGVTPGPGPIPATAETKPTDAPPRPVLLTGKGTEILVGIERSMENATRALGSAAPAAKSDSTPPAASIQQRRTSLPADTVASASDRTNMRR